jgi:hypothetical protein
MDASGLQRRLRSPEECVALLKYHVAGSVMAVASFAVISVMAGLAWRVVAS